MPTMGCVPPEGPLFVPALDGGLAPGPLVVGPLSNTSMPEPPSVQVLVLQVRACLLTGSQHGVSTSLQVTLPPAADCAGVLGVAVAWVAASAAPNKAAHAIRPANFVM
jgi:hypothetical protein